MTGESASPLVERVRARLAASAGAPSAAAVAALVREESGGLLGDRAVLDAVRAATDELSGAGVLEPLLRLPGVTDVLVNGPSSVWIDRGGGLLSDASHKICWSSHFPRPSRPSAGNVSFPFVIPLFFPTGVGGCGFGRVIVRQRKLLNAPLVEKHLIFPVRKGL